MKITLKQTSDYEIPADLQLKLDKNTALKNAFETLTPGRQRAYLFYFSQAKKSKTRTARVEHNIDQILAGKGLAD